MFEQQIVAYMEKRLAWARGKICPLIAPQDYELPLIVYQKTVSATKTHDEYVLRRGTFRADVWAKTYTEAAQGGSEVAAILQDWQSGLWQVARVDTESVTYEAGNDLYRGTVTFTIIGG